MNKKVNYTWILLVSGIILFFFHLGKLYVDIMEARNFLSAREMVLDNHWIFTTMNGEPRYEKPPLPTWLSAFFGYIFSPQNVWALRFPAALFALLNVLYLNKIVKLFTDNKQAFLASIIFATSFLVIYVGRRANWDIYSYSFATIGLYYFILGMREIKAFKNFLIAGILFGFSFLSKGPTGHYVIVLPFFIGYVLAFGFPRMKTIWWIVFCAAITFAVGLPWYLYVYHYDPETFMAILDKETAARENRDVKPFTRYLNFPVQTGVWAFFSIMGLIYPYIKKRTVYKKEYTMFFAWTLLSLLFLSLVPSKKERYLYPMLIPLSVTTGFYVRYIIESTKLLKWETIFNKVVYFILGIIPLAVSAMVLAMTKFNFWSAVLVISMLGISFLIIKFSLKSKFYDAFLAVVVLLHLVVIFGFPKLDEIFHSNENYKSIATAKPIIEKDNAKLYSYKIYQPEVWFHYGETMPSIDFTEEKLPQEKKFYILTYPELPSKTIDSLQSQNFKVEPFGMYDSNEENTKAKNYTHRKLDYLYKVERK